jgi:hypothetical protein
MSPKKAPDSGRVEGHFIGSSEKARQKLREGPRRRRMVLDELLRGESGPMLRIGRQLFDGFNSSPLKMFIQKSLPTINIRENPIQKSLPTINVRADPIQKS